MSKDRQDVCSVSCLKVRLGYGMLVADEKGINWFNSYCGVYNIVLNVHRICTQTFINYGWNLTRFGRNQNSTTTYGKVN